MLKVDWGRVAMIAFLLIAPGWAGMAVDLIDCRTDRAIAELRAEYAFRTAGYKRQERFNAELVRMAIEQNNIIIKSKSSAIE